MTANKEYTEKEMAHLSYRYALKELRRLIDLNSPSLLIQGMIRVVNDKHRKYWALVEKETNCATI